MNEIKVDPYFKASISFLFIVGLNWGILTFKTTSADKASSAETILAPYLM